jgi:Family of unknown function (DUF6527)
MRLTWWQWLPLQRWRVVGAVESADEIPEGLPRNAAVLVGDPEDPKWIAFDCPCRSGHRVILNTDPRRAPVWHISTSRKGRGLTIKPSVDFHDRERRCHYFVRNGQILWARET